MASSPSVGFRGRVFTPGIVYDILRRSQYEQIRTKVQNYLSRPLSGGRLSSRATVSAI
jgi:hypothetical protein